MSNIAVILAKKESKRLPNKNFLKFNGVSAFYYSALQAQQANIFDKIVVSIDMSACVEPDTFIEYYMRKPENTKTESTMYSALKEVLDNYKGYDNVCLIHACSPLLKSEYIVKAYDKLINNDYDTVIPAVKDDGYGMYSYDDKIYLLHNENKRINSQYQIEYYKNVGMFYWCKIDGLLKNETILCDNMGYIILNKMQCQDIDDEYDWQIAKWKYDNGK